MKKSVLIIFFIIFISCVYAFPQIRNIGFDYNNGINFYSMTGNLSYGFLMETDRNPSTNYFIQFSNSTYANEILADEMVGMFLINSSTPVNQLKDYYDARNGAGMLPEPFLSYLKNAADGINPFVYINTSSLKLVDAAKFDILNSISDMTIPGDYPAGIYSVQGEIKNLSNDARNLTLTLIINGGLRINDKKDDSGCLLENENVTLYANITGVCIRDITFSLTLNSSNFNFSGVLSDDLGNYEAEVSSSILFDNGGNLASWTVYASDCLNHTIQDGTENFYVNKITRVYVNPSSPDGNNNWYVTEPEFTLVNDDAGSIYYSWANDVSFLYNGSFKLENVANLKQITAGILELEYWSDVCNESKQFKSLDVDLTNPEIKNLVPENNSEITNLTAKIGAYIDEIYGTNSGVNLSSIRMRINNIIVNPTSFLSNDSKDAFVSYYPNNTLLILGINEISVFASDFAGRNSELNWTFNITSPGEFNITLNNPMNRSFDNPYSAKRIAFNISSNSRINWLQYYDLNDTLPRWKTLCKNCMEYGNLRLKELLFADGEHNLIIKANDSFGQEAFVNVRFFVDSTLPRIISILPRTGIYTNGTGFSVKYSETNLKNVTLNWNPQIGMSCASGINQICGIVPDLTGFDGQKINFWYEVSDYARKTVSRNISLNVDISSPKITNITDSKSRNYITLNVSIDETNLKSVSYREIGKSLWSSMCSSLNNGMCSKKIYFAAGNHTIEIKALDKAGNSAIEQWSFSI